MVVWNCLIPHNTISMAQYTHLSEEERNIIYLLLLSGSTQAAIAEKLGRPPSTVSRELKRNKSLINKDKNWSKNKQKEDYHYLPDSAQKKYENRRKLCGWRPPLKNMKIFNYVVDHLQAWWSPDIVAGTLRNEYPDDQTMRISHECIYQFIYSKKWEELKLKCCLIRSHKRRKKKIGRSVRKASKIPNRVDISLRPESVLERKEFWHFEGDSILSERPSKSALRTEVERMSRKIFSWKIPRKTAENTKKMTLFLYKNIPKRAIKSITWDNGSEHSKHEEVAKGLRTTIYFAHPYHSWERWTNEHANGMIRRFFPKGTNFDEVTDEQIQKVVDYLNNRPRKILWYKTPNEVFESLLSTIS